jgi:hypothetical protein
VPDKPPEKREFTIGERVARQQCLRHIGTCGHKKAYAARRDAQA